jgi:hypothetical protein
MHYNKSEKQKNDNYNYTKNIENTRNDLNKKMN